jgi:dihydrofolate synthase/folylpolyglutamate synthase
VTSSPRRDFTLERWLAHFETLHPKKIDMGLERLTTMLDRLGLRRPRAKVITVAGTNGKGSCVAMLESIYWHAGYRVGVFTSPHLWRFNERVRFDGVDAADEDLVDAFRSLDDSLGDVTLSYFEASFVAALLLFARRDAEVIVLEVGMGGRLDATNTVDTDCALIVSIDLDHREFLGDTREEIGREKAGIMRAGKPVVVADRAVPASVLAHAAAVGAPALVIGRDFDFEREGSRWRRSGDARRTLLPLPPFGGAEQFANAASCAVVARELSEALPVRDDALADGIARAYLRGRLERHDVGGVEWVFDVGHNPAAAAGLAAALERLPAARSTWVLFAAMRDKDLAGVLQPLVGVTTRFVVTRASSDRGATALELELLLESLGARSVVAVDGGIEAACAHLREATAPGDRVLVYGSFHTVGAAMEALRLYLRASPLSDRPATWTRV